MQVPEHVLTYYRQPARMTDLGRHEALLAPLPRDVAGLASVGHGLLIHEHWARAYGVTLSEDERATVHIRPAADLLDAALSRDGGPLARPRPLAGRVACNCRHFTVQIVALLRAQGTPARARCGFGRYFTESFYEDHWVGEYWHAGQRRWALVDAQIDERQRDMLGLGFDVTDVPRDEFVVAGRAWELYRSGAVDPDRFGLSVIGETGAWWIAANLMRDAAALRNVEVLPWDVWGAMPEPSTVIGDDELDLFDRLAALTQDPDGSFDELAKLYEDNRLRVPAAVRNAVRQRQEEL
jgi:Transglutaminase-like superfamily